MLIVSSADEKYLPHFATLLSSLSVSNPHARVVLLDCGNASESLEKLQAFACEVGISLEFVRPDLSPFANAWVGHLSLAAYARILIAELFPDEARAIYIDADCIVLESLNEVWAMDLEGAIVAGVHDENAANLERLEGSAHCNYVNSGFLLMDLPAWRAHRVSEKILSKCGSNIARIFHDQTLINEVVGSRKKLISDHWNCMVGGFDITGPGVPLKRRPAVVHFTVAKPWEQFDAPFGALYRTYRARTPFPPAQARWRRPPHRRVLGWLMRRRKYVNLFRNEAMLRRLVERPHLRRLERTMPAVSTGRRAAT